MLQDCTQQNAFALTAKNYVFYRYCKRLQVAETSQKVTQLDILCVSPTFLYIAMQNSYVTTTANHKTNVQMRFTFFDAFITLA